MWWSKYLDKVINVAEGEAVTVTDPCYDVGGGLTLNLPTGRYECFYDLSDEGDWGVRVARAAIYKQGCRGIQFDSYEKFIAGSAGVDAGLCGFFVNKPDYSDDAWSEFCDRLRKIDEEYCKQTGKHYKEVYHTDEGFFTASGYGDGEYNVYLLTEGSVPVGAMIVFIGDDYEDEDDWAEDEDEDE